MSYFSADWAIHAIETLLYSISTVLYLPVLLGLTGLSLYLLICLGGFAGEWRERRRGIRPLLVSAQAQMASVAAATDDQPALEAHLERMRMACVGLIRCVSRCGSARPWA